jgi:hypothetical protein
VPVIVRLEGTNVEGRELLANSGLAITPADDHQRCGAESRGIGQGGLNPHFPVGAPSGAILFAIRA